MSLVNTETGELLDVEDAERRASFICTDLDHVADSFETAMGRLREAIDKRDDIALGYRSPGDYLSDRFGGRLARLGVDLRREVVRELTDRGLSMRAIAPVVGTSHVTVKKDLDAGVNRVNTSPSPVPSSEGEASDGAGHIAGIDGKVYARPAPIDHAAQADAAVAEFPDLAYYRDETGDLEHCWRLADKLRDFRDRGELSDRLDTLRRSIELDRSKRDGTYVPVTTTVPSGPETCPTCGQTIKD